MVSDISIRMKSYETAYDYQIKDPDNNCIIIRVDGHNFSKFTKGFNKPFDNAIIEAKHKAMMALCHEFANIIFAYEQSDEITLVIRRLNPKYDYVYNNRVQKLCSLTAGLATAVFNKSLLEYVDMHKAIYPEKCRRIINKIGSAYFDSRVYSIPIDDAANCILWRVMDAKRNSILNCAYSTYKNDEVKNKSCSVLMEMLKDSKNNWFDLKDRLKYGSFAVRMPITINDQVRYKWHVFNMIEPKTKDFYNKFNELLERGYITSDEGFNEICN